MPFVKLDCGMLNSTIWVDLIARELFITSLLMAEPLELKQPTKQLNVRDLTETGYEVPVGWYGFVPAAGAGIIRRAMLEAEEGLCALDRLGSPDPESRSQAHEGRRLVRIDGGYLVLNFDAYRERDYTSAERSKRYRDKKLLKRHTVTTDRHTVATRSVTQAEAEEEVYSGVPESSKLSKFPKFSEFWKAFPINKGSRTKALDVWRLFHCEDFADVVIKSVLTHASLPDWQKDAGKWIPSAVKFLEDRKWENKLTVDAPKPSGLGTGIFAPGGEMDPNRKTS